MQFRRLGKTHWKVSALSLGGAPWMSRIGGKASEHAIRTAIDSGINFFDTAPMYGQGESEKLLAKLTSAVRDQVFITTKVGQLVPGYVRLLNPVKPLVRSFLSKVGKNALRRVGGAVTNRTLSNCFDETSIIRSVEQSLRRMRTDRINALLLHGPSWETLSTGAFASTLEKLRAQGKVQHFGVAVDHWESVEKLSSLNLDLFSILQIPLPEDLPRARKLLQSLSNSGLGLVGRGVSKVGNRFAESLENALQLPELGSVLVNMTTPEHIVDNCRLTDQLATRGQTA